MATVPEKRPKIRFLDNAKMRAIVDKAFAEMGFVPVPGATAERAQQMMREAGVRPEDNLFSRGIIEMREE